MQQTKKSIFEKYLIGMTGSAWVAGLLIAGSDSPFMPWVNGMGLLLFFGSSVMLGKFLHPSPLNANTKIAPRIRQLPALKARRLKKRNNTINNQYVLQI